MFYAAKEAHLEIVLSFKDLASDTIEVNPFTTLEVQFYDFVSIDL